MTQEKIIQQYGRWDSPISASSMANGISLSGLDCDMGQALVWLEGRSDRGVLVVDRLDGQAPFDLTSQFSVRGGVGYGGGEFTARKGQVYFAEANSGRLYRQSLLSGSAHAVTPAFGKAASPCLSPDGRWLMYVHSDEGQDSLSLVDARGIQWPQKLTWGADFYMQPAWHPSGKKVAWIAWNHPNMPWDGTSLFLAELNSSEPPAIIGTPFRVAGGEQISIFQPQFSLDGEWLAYVSDDTGWWQIYLYNLVSGEQRQITHTPAEHGLPAWVQGMRTYAFTLDSQVIYFLRNQLGRTSLWKVDLINGGEQQLPVPAIYTHLEQLCVTSLGIAMLASGPALGSQVILLPVSDGGVKERVRILRRSRSEELPADIFSIPQDVSWSGMDGEMVYGLFYPPVSDRYEGVGKPPLIVMIHGGPTGQSLCSFDLQVQFFTSRGYAVLDVNYRGSSGYGRAYREKLRGMWGVHDVQDTVSGARFVTDQGWADSSKMVIMGGSAGGLSVLKILEDYPGVFKAGICLYARGADPGSIGRFPGTGR